MNQGSLLVANRVQQSFVGSKIRGPQPQGETAIQCLSQTCAWASSLRSKPCVKPVRRASPDRNQPLPAQSPQSAMFSTISYHLSRRRPTMKNSECSFLFQVQVAFFSLHPTGPREKCLAFNSFTPYASLASPEVGRCPCSCGAPLASTLPQLLSVATSVYLPRNVSLLVDICTGRSGFTSLRQQLQTRPSLPVGACHPGFSQSGKDAIRELQTIAKLQIDFIISWGSSKGV